MPASYVQYPGNGATTLFSVPFPYLLRAHVKAYINYNLITRAYAIELLDGTGFAWVSDTQISTTVPVASGSTLTLIRVTPSGSQIVNWSDGSGIISFDLNTSDRQNLYVAQEWIDYAINTNDLSQTALATANDAYTFASTYQTLVQTETPAGNGWPIGKAWLQNDVNKTFAIWDGSAWLGIASGGTFTLQPTVIYVDSINGNDFNDGHRIINPKKTIRNAVASASAGDIIKVAPGVYRETIPIDVTVSNLSLVGDATRSCFVHPTPATETQIMFRCNSGTYIDGFTFCGLKASGARGSHAIDSDSTYGLPQNQGWVAGFYPGATIRKSPWIQNCTNFADAGIDNSNFDPNNYTGTGGDVTSAPTGGGIIVDGSLPAINSPLRSFVINEFTQVCLDGPGLLVCNNGYAQAVSFFGTFCHYHAKALSGGQINMEVGTTDFGRYGLIADGKSSSAIFTATANGNASAGAVTFAINAPTAAGSWFGDATRPNINMLVQIGSDTYPILSSGPNGSGWNVTISRPNPSNRAENLGLINGHNSGAAVSFFLRSMISTASHTMEYAGSGTNYNALPENGGVAIEANEAISRNGGKVWLTSTDQNGKFKVGDTFQVDQQTGFVTIDPQSYSTNLVSDLTPELGGDLDVLAKRIYSSVGNVRIDDTLNVTGPIQAPSGTAAAPGFAFDGDPDTGLFSPGANGLAISTGGIGRVFIDASGYLRLASKGIQFNGDTADANSLDDYEEGTFTATLRGGTTDPSTPVLTTGTYTKIGNIVYAYINFMNVDTTGATGSVSVTGLPFASSSSHDLVGSAAAFFLDLNNGTSLFSMIQPAGATIRFYSSVSNGAWASLLHSAGTGRYLHAAISYRA